MVPNLFFKRPKVQLKRDGASDMFLELGQMNKKKRSNKMKGNNKRERETEREEKKE